MRGVPQAREGHVAQPRSIERLTNAIASGDTEAFAVFYREWFDRMYRDAQRATRRDESFCLDVVQDAMLRAMKSMRTMDSEARLAGWLRTVVRSCAVDRIRAETRRRRRELETLTETGTSSAGTADTVAQARARDDGRLAWLAEELKKLDETQRQLLHRRFHLGWTLQRIGVTLGLSAGAVDGRINRVLRSLRDKRQEPVNDA